VPGGIFLGGENLFTLSLKEPMLVSSREVAGGRLSFN